MKHPHKGTWRTALFLVLLAAAVIGLRAIPTLTVGGYEVKRVDILADVMPSADSPEVTVAPLPAVVKAQAAFRDSCPEGMVCVEDYAPAEGHGMAHFYDALSRRSALGRPVRVAYFGDSFIEGDILTADLRSLLQQRFGGCGVGFVDIASPFTQLRSSVSHRAEGWTDHNVLEKQGLDRSRLGISCRYALGGPGANVRYGSVKGYARLDSFEVATLFLAPTTATTVGVSLNGADATRHTVDATRRIEAVTDSGRLKSVRYDVVSGNATYYGVALEGRAGIVVDNFSLRGSSGAPLAEIPEAALAGFNAVRPYDLIVLQFGLNVATKNLLKYDYYVRQMKPVIDRFKRAFPHAAILVVSVGDREDRTDGRLCTMPGVKALINYQQAMAAEEEVAFWNLYEAMGGEGAISRMAAAQPAEAGKDYTHINRRGGRRLATILYRTLLHGYEQYEKKKAYEHH